VGLAVAGGIALIGAVVFIVWKLTRTRSFDFDDDGAIKWPELNNETHALPARPTGRSGIGNDVGGGSDQDLFSAHTAANSTADLHPMHTDAFAVPPLPTHNPAVPLSYRDDMSSSGQYYDPYRGPVPQTFRTTPPGSVDGHGAAPPGAWAGQQAEAIPMNTYPPRSRSPGPNSAYGPASGGRHSPGPSLGYGPQSGRQSPGPGSAYGGDPRTRSPGPNVAYDAGRRSPGPASAYDDEDAYGGVR